MPRRARMLQTVTLELEIGYPDDINFPPDELAESVMDAIGRYDEIDRLFNGRSPLRLVGDLR
jgi:hypothetical protein